MNRCSTVITASLFVIVLTACGSPQAAAPAAPAKIEVTYYPQPTKPAAQSSIIRVNAPAATATPRPVVEPAQPTAVAAITEVAPTETPVPTEAPPAPTDTPAAQVVVMASDGTIEDVRNEMLALHNQARADAGLPPYAVNNALQQAAQSHAAWLAQKSIQALWSIGIMSHFGENNTSYVDRISAAGYATSANRLNENYGTFGSARDAFDWWMNDAAGASSHRPQILSPLYTEIGIGVVKHSSGLAYVFIINFGTR